MLKRSLLALAVVATTAAAVASSHNTTAPLAAANDHDDDEDDDKDDGGRRPPRPPPPPHHRPPPGRGPRCTPPVAAGVLPAWAHERSRAVDPLCVAHNAQMLALFDADHDGELNVDEWHAHLRSRPPHGPHGGPHEGAHDGPHARHHASPNDERFALVSSAERQELVDGASALSRVIVRLPLWFPLWLSSLTTSSNNEAVH